MVTAADAPLALTMGDPAGIGGEITLKAWGERTEHELPCFFLLDNPDRVRLLATALGLAVPVVEITDPSEAWETFSTALPVLPIGPVPATVMGKASPATAGAVLRSIDEAVGLCLAGDASAVVTNPIQKSALYAEGFEFEGHTDYLAAISARDAEPPTPVMMLASRDLRVVPVTIHEALSRVPTSLTTEKIIEVARITAAGLTRDFGIKSPRLVVAGLNPHAGEAGTIGDEEGRIIEPAIHKLQAEGMSVTGPHAADTLFHAAARETYDVALCMYHDQALIPIKTIAFDTAVNVTLGLPIVRTSPDHGTALDIAGTGKASPRGLIAAIKLAGELAERRDA